MLLNPQYYVDLLTKYQSIKLLENNLSDKIAELSLKIIVQQSKNRQPIHLNFQNHSATLQNITKSLFIELANQIFCNAADFPQLKIGDKVKSKTPMRVGLAQPKCLVFTIESVQNNKYKLRNERHSLVWEKSYSEVVQKFFTVSHNAQNETLNRFGSFFEKLNEGHVHDFIPTFFERKSVFIAPKTFYDSLEVKNKIPTTYFPNPREEANPHETKSIPALPDSIMYFAPKYKVCYDKILLQGKKIDTIVVYDTEETEIEQIIQDKNRFGFNLIVLTNNVIATKCNQTPFWNWFKEEFQIINAL